MRVRSASGSATLTRLLELAAARSGTGDLERSRGTVGSRPHFQELRVTARHPHAEVLHECSSTNCLLWVQYCPLEVTAVASSNSCWPLTIASGMMLCPCNGPCRIA